MFMFMVTGWENLATNRAFGFVFKLTISVSLLWLAWPDLIKLNQRLPPRFIIVAFVALFVTLIQPRLGMVLIGGVIAYTGIWWIYRRVFDRKLPAVQRRPRPSRETSPSREPSQKTSNEETESPRRLN